MTKQRRPNIWWHRQSVSLKTRLEQGYGLLVTGRSRADELREEVKPLRVTIRKIYLGPKSRTYVIRAARSRIQHTTDELEDPTIFSEDDEKDHDLFDAGYFND